MRTYLYGLILSRNAHLVPPGVIGIHGAALRILPLDQLAALVSDVGAASSSDLDALRAHDRVMQAVVGNGATATAVRFGQTFADDAELLRHLGERASQLRSALDHLDGLVEMRLLMPLPAEEPVAPKPASPGTAYLESLRGSPRMAGLALRDAIGPVVRGECVEELARAKGVAFAHLIRREDEREYRDAVRAQPSLAEATIVGPLALYAFGEGGGAS